MADSFRDRRQQKRTDHRSWIAERQTVLRSAHTDQVTVHVRKPFPNSGGTKRRFWKIVCVLLNCFVFVRKGFIVRYCSLFSSSPSAGLARVALTVTAVCGL